jgi:glycosyltransferase involved in cell wall biosynthesis
MHNPARVLFVGPFPPPYGGIANHTRLLYESDLNQQFDLRRVNLSLQSELTENVSQKRSVNLGKGLRGLRNIVSALVREKPDLIYMKVSASFGCVREMAYMSAVRSLSNVPIIMHFHGMFKEYTRNFPFVASQRDNRLNKAAINALFALPHRAIFLSPVLLDDFSPLLTAANRAKSTAIEHFVDVSFFGEREPNHDGRKNILFVGRLSQEKGFFELLEAIPVVAERHPDVRFHVCGSAESDVALAPVQEAVDLFVASGILRLHGLVHGEEKRKVFARSDIMVLPTHNEVFPNVILEGLGQGLPIVTTKVGVTASVIEEGVNGLYMEVGDANGLAQRLLQLLDNPELQREMSVNNRRKAVQRFDKPIAVAKLAEVFAKELQRCQT